MLAKIAEKREIAEGTLYTKFALSEEIDFNAGQFFRITLPDPLYKDKRGNSRFLGFLNNPTQNKVIETVTRLGPSAFKRTLFDLEIGSEILVGDVSGDMTLPKDFQMPWIIITGGIGIVPYISMFREIKEKTLPYKIDVIVSNTKRSWAILTDELQSYAEDNPNFRFIPTVTQDSSWQGEERRISEGFLKEKISNPKEALFYISGTPRFVPSIVNAIKSLEVDAKNIKFEIFTGY